jgi:hypothetical protein
MGERRIRRDGKGGAILSQAFQPLFVAEALAFFWGKMCWKSYRFERLKWDRLWLFGNGVAPHNFRGADRTEFALRYETGFPAHFLNAIVSLRNFDRPQFLGEGVVRVTQYDVFFCGV